MKTYTALVRPAGNLLHEVPKTDLTAAEVFLLRSVHGDDGVVQLKPLAATTKVNDTEERNRLKSIYGEKAFSRVFGSTFGSTLPEEVPPSWLAGAVPVEEQAAAA